MNLTYIWLLISCRMVFIVKGEILKDISRLSTSEKDLKNSKFNLETIPCYRRIKRRSFISMGCKGNNVVLSFGTPKARKKTSSSSSEDNQVQESTNKPIPISSQESAQAQPTPKFEEEISHTFYDSEQGPKKASRKRPPRPPRPPKPRLSVDQAGRTTSIDSIPPKLAETEVRKETIKELDHEDILPNPKPLSPSPSPSPWVVRLKKYQTTAAEFVQELKKSYRAIVLDHGEPEMDRTRDKITSFFEKFWIWLKSIPKTYRVFFKSEPRPEDLPEDALFLSESAIMTPEQIQKDIDSYLRLEHLFSVDREKETIRKKVVKYLSDSQARHVKLRLNKDPDLLGLTIPEMSRAMLIKNLAMTIEDSSESEKDRLDSTLLLKFIDSLGKSQYAKVTIERIKEKLMGDPFEEEFDLVTPSLVYLDRNLREKVPISSLSHREDRTGSGRLDGINQIDHLGSSSRRHQ